MLRNINNFFNIIKRKRLKTTLDPNDMIAIGTRDVINRSEYQDTAITFADLEAQVAVAGAQGPPGVTGATGAIGDDGPAGPVGAAGLIFQGTWSAASPYVVGDVVFYNGSSYVCSNPVGPTATTPDVDVANWDFLALQGLQGPAGSGFTVQDASRVTSVPAVGAQFAFRQLLVPANSFSTGDIFNVIAGFMGNSAGGAGTFIYELYINTVPGLVGATNLFDQEMTNNREYLNSVQTFYIDSSGTGFTTGPAATIGNNNPSGFTQYNSMPSNWTIDWTVDQYIIVGGRNSSTRDVINLGARIF